MHKMPIEQTEKIPENAIAVNIQQYCLLLGCGKQSAEKIAAAAGAKIKIGKRSLYSIEKTRIYLDSIAE
jgi:hypothetical protein